MELPSRLAVALIGLLGLASACGEPATGPPGDPTAVVPPEASPPPTGPAPARGTPHIYLANSDGTGITRLVQGESPAWSPDGKRIAFGRRATRDLHIVDSDGSNVTRPEAQDRFVPPSFAEADGFPGYPAWSPDGLRLAFSRGGLYSGDLLVMNVADDGHVPVRLAGDAVYPAWSRDGKKLAFVRLSGDDGYNTIDMMNADGSQAAALTRPAGGSSRPTWSPDGKRVAFGDCNAGECMLYLANLGGGVAQIPALREVSIPAWSPDGSTIAVGAEGGIWTVSADGGDAKLLISGGTQPAWSPDGKKIAFVVRGG